MTQYFTKNIEISGYEKLFLCTTDIKVGDMVRPFSSPNLELEVVSINGNEVELNGEEIFTIHMDKIFKTIGRISNKALSYVHEGMLLDRNQVIALEHPGLSIRRSIERVREEFIKDGTVLIYVKNEAGDFN